MVMPLHACEELESHEEDVLGEDLKSESESVLGELGAGPALANRAEELWEERNCRR